MENSFDFDAVLPRDEISALKWEAEIQRLGDPSLLCLGIADMDFRPAPAIEAALTRVVRAGHLGYPLVRSSCYDAVSGYMQRHFGWEVPREWIGSNVAIYTSMHPFIDGLSEPGDEIVYQPPVHHVFEEMIRASGRVPVANPLVRTGGRYEMDLDGLERSITPRTKLLLLCSPHNPVGRVWSRAELERLHRVVARHGITVLSDEVYAGLLYPGLRHVPFASLSAEASARTVTMFSASKSFNVTGLKHSLVIAESPELRALYQERLKRSDLHFGASIFGLAATEAALRDCDEWSDALMRHVSSNHEFLARWLAEAVPEASLFPAEATYFAWIDVSGLVMTRAELVGLVERKARLSVTFGYPMGREGENCVRLNLACARPTLAAALERLGQAVAELRRTRTLEDGSVG